MVKLKEVSIKNQRDNVGDEKKWKKNCPECGKEQKYSTKYTLVDSIKKNTLCNKCNGNKKRIEIPNKGWSKLCLKCGCKQVYSCKSALTTSIKKNNSCNRCGGNERKINPPNGKWKRICSICRREIIYETRKGYLLGNKRNSICRKCATKKGAEYADKSYFKTPEYRNKMSNVLKLARKTDSYGEAFKEKCRINKLKQIKTLGTQYTFNPIACEFIDALNQHKGWKLIHALNGGEYKVCGYSVDGYDKDRNVVFEYDEPKHNTPYHKKRDKIRETRIISKIKPFRFLRYDEEHDILYDALNEEVMLCRPQ